jgi:hypothetical protein
MPVISAELLSRTTGGIINNDSFSIVTTTGVPMHFYDQALDNRKTLVIDTAAGQLRTSVIIANA